jgi:hypothetical protein
MSAKHATADLLRIARIGNPTDANEPDYDIHLADRILADPRRLEAALELVRGGASGMFQPTKIKTIKGMGTVWDYRRFTQPNGGPIEPLVFVQHIPVIRQMDGRADLDVLWRVLVSQGLMVHNGTDAEGNVALYCRMDRLCFHARGGNSVSCGTEHMHLTTAEDWSDRQLNAAAYLSNRAYENQDLPRRHGNLDRGPGFVKVRRRGHVTHEAVSAKAGFNDRSDPGERYEALMEEIKDRAVFYGRNHRF